MEYKKYYKMEGRNLRWDLNEFRGLFRAKYGDALSPRIESYLFTLEWKVKRAQYHANKVDEYWKTLIELTPLSRSLVRTSHSFFLEALYFSAFEMEAMIQTLHSYGDVIAQIVNTAFFGNSLLEEDEVSLKRMLDKVSKSIPLGVSLQNFYNSSEYKYVAAFCNIIKHRKLIDVDYYKYRDMVKRDAKEGFRFKDFTYKRDSFKATLFNEITNNYRIALFDSFKFIGVEMNNFLR